MQPSGERKRYDFDLSGAKWRVSSGTHQGNSVEVAIVGDAIAVRDSDNPAGPVLLFTRGEWEAFVFGAKGGEFDL
jgi:hypothetical protein